MAKGKHSVALFEVIQAGRATRSGGGSLATPKWWFKRRNAADTAAAAKSEAVASLPAPADVPAVFAPHNLDTAPSATLPATPRATAVNLKVDPDRQRISFHFTYTSAIIVAFSVIVVVSLAYIIGNRVNQGPTEALAGPSVDELRTGAVQAAVMNVSNSAPVTNAASSRKPAPVVEREEATTAMPIPIARNVPQAGSLAPTVSPSGQRVSGLNYIIAQAWPEAEKQMAVDACEFLNKNGIACTVEADVPGYMKYSVVTLAGFTGRSAPDYLTTEKAIKDLSDKFAKTSKFKRFSPIGKKW